MLCEHLDLWIIIVFIASEDRTLRSVLPIAAPSAPILGELRFSGSAYLTHGLTFKLPQPHHQQQNVKEKQRNEHSRD